MREDRRKQKQEDIGCPETTSWFDTHESNIPTPNPQQRYVAGCSFSAGGRWSDLPAASRSRSLSTFGIQHSTVRTLPLRPVALPASGFIFPLQRSPAQKSTYDDGTFCQL